MTELLDTWKAILQYSITVYLKYWVSWIQEIYFPYYFPLHSVLFIPSIPSSCCLSWWQSGSNCSFTQTFVPIILWMSKKSIWSEYIKVRLEYSITKGCDMGSVKKGSLIVFVTGWHPWTSSANTEHVLEIKEWSQVWIVNFAFRLPDTACETE